MITRFSRFSLATLAVLTVGGLCCTASAAAYPAEDQPVQPVPVPPPAPPTGLFPPLAGIGNVLAQADSPPSGPFGLPDLSAHAPALLLAQNPVPVAPDDPAVPPLPGPQLPSLSAFNPDYLIGQNLEPAAPGEGTAAPGLGPTVEDSGTGRLSFLRRLYEMYDNGQLEGAFLGQRPTGVPTEVLPTP